MDKFIWIVISIYWSAQIIVKFVGKRIETYYRKIYERLRFGNCPEFDILFFFTSMFLKMGNCITNIFYSDNHIWQVIIGIFVKMLFSDR